MSDALDELFGPPVLCGYEHMEIIGRFASAMGRSSRANRLPCQEIEYRSGVFSRPSTKRLTFFYRMANT